MADVKDVKQWRIRFEITTTGSKREAGPCAPLGSLSEIGVTARCDQHYEVRNVFDGAGTLVRDETSPYPLWRGQVSVSYSIVQLAQNAHLETVAPGAKGPFFSESWSSGTGSATLGLDFGISVFARLSANWFGTSDFPYTRAWTGREGEPMYVETGDPKYIVSSSGSEACNAAIVGPEYDADDNQLELMPTLTFDGSRLVGEHTVVGQVDIDSRGTVMATTHVRVVATDAALSPDDDDPGAAWDDARAAAFRFGTLFINEARVRARYLSRIGEMAEKMLADMRAGRVGRRQASELAYVLRNHILQQSRAVSAPVGQAVAEGLKLEGPKYVELLEKHAARLHGSEFSKLDMFQRNAVFEAIVESSGHDRGWVSKTMPVLGLVGKAAVAITAAHAIVDVYAADNKLVVALDHVMTFGGSVAGAELMSVGAALICGPGAIVAVPVAFIVGGIAGALVGGQLAQEMTTELGAWLEP